MPSGHLITYQTFFHFPCVFRLCTLRKFREVWLKRNSFVPLCMDSNNIWNIVQNLRYLTLIFQNPPLINNIRFFYEYYYKFPPLSQSPLNFLSFLFFYTFTSRNSYRKLKTLTFCFDCTNFHLDDQIIPTNDWTWNNMDPFVPRPTKPIKVSIIKLQASSTHDAMSPVIKGQWRNKSRRRPVSRLCIHRCARPRNV